MVEVAPSSYEDVPYESYPFADSHPDRLATVAMLFGLTPPALTRARVLELGCAGGGNLIPIAQELPEATFVGIDLSSRQVADGRAMIEALGLRNVDLRAASIVDLDDSLGPFDYILCHGVYSWVPAEVQRRILEICARRLSPQGVAYVSYNTYPGWHLRGMVREMMTYHVEPVADPQARITEARSFLEFLVRSVWSPASVYARVLEDQASRIRPRLDSYVFHEFLEEVNAPVYYHEFVARAQAHQLRVLGDARYAAMLENAPAELRARLEALTADPVRQEQYLDFLRNRTFRRSLLCHADVELAPAPRPEALAALHVLGMVAPAPERTQPEAPGVETFRTPDGGTIRTDDPLIKAALGVLRERLPRPIPFEDLWSAVTERLKRLPIPHATQPERDRRRLQEFLLQGYVGGWVALHAYVPRFAASPGERPVASPLARLQAETGTRVTDLWHRTAELSRFDRHVLRHLDGRHDRAELCTIVSKLVAEGALEIKGAGPPPHDPAKIREIVSQAFEASLSRLAAGALLVG